MNLSFKITHEIPRLYLNEFNRTYGKSFRTAPYYCKTNLFSLWKCIVFVIVFSVQELNA